MGVLWRVAGLLAAAAFAAGAPTAAAATLPSSSTPLAGSTFQGGDGNQDDLAPYVDWEGLQASGGVTHSPDPNEHDSAFAGGAQEGEPRAWDLTTEHRGVSPAHASTLAPWTAAVQ